MRYTPAYVLADADEVKRLIRENPWATIISNTAAGLVASHYPVVLEEDAEGISIVSHVGRPDERLHELGEHEILVIIQGPHGYISPSWYGDVPAVPTWNHVTAHLYGTPEILSDAENYRVLGELVDYFENRMPEPARLEYHEEYATRIAVGTVGFRLRVTRFDARLKLSQNKTPEIVETVIEQLEHGDNYANPALAAEMRRVHDDRQPGAGQR
ncbi:FMN-binding negative transcriptional regulator [soil metagenome]